MSFLNKRIQFQKLRRNGRQPSNYPTDGVGIPLRITRHIDLTLPEVTPETIRDARKEKDIVCMSEMMTLFDCFQKHEFDKNQCENQAKALEHCYKSYVTQKDSRRVRKAESRLKPA